MFDAGVSMSATLTVFCGRGWCIGMTGVPRASWIGGTGVEYVGGGLKVTGAEDFLAGEVGM